MPEDIAFFEDGGVQAPLPREDGEPLFGVAGDDRQLEVRIRTLEQHIGFPDGVDERYEGADIRAEEREGSIHIYPSDGANVLTSSEYVFQSCGRDGIAREVAVRPFMEGEARTRRSMGAEVTIDDQTYVLHQITY